CARKDYYGSTLGVDYW
nr:immunoglobulin heavy chain junction region [Mus musculus]NSM04090.1 immunoglobulin heavy chain junction region [Mus musculus]NSM04171.1 immunoglobulin heavy chain junction region [Mus musculus]NSM04416.1 immunoglobulin heavy chain junction region [Mus musculus]NSM04433.1 immunoglobulin heavy chain junction region [Mus musculus]